MEFITNNVAKNTTITSSVYSSSNNVGLNAVPTFLKLVTNSENIVDGIIKKYTNLGGTHGGVTDSTANYLISSSTGNTNNGWIFQNYNSLSGTTNNVASLDGEGNFFVNGHINCDVIDCGTW